MRLHSIAENAIKLRATSVKEIMIPKVEMVNIYIDDSSEKLLETVIESTTQDIQS